MCRFEHKKEATRQTIIELAMLLFKRQGFDATTMEQIADEVDIARKTLYNHFPVKDAIITGYVQRVLKEQWDQTIQQLQELPDTRSRLTAALLRGWEWAKAELTGDILEKYYSYRRQTLLQSFKDRGHGTGLADLLAYIIRLGQKAGEIRQDLQGEELASYLDCNHTITVLRWLANPERFPIQEGIARSVGLFLDGAKTGVQN